MKSSEIAELAERLQLIKRYLESEQCDLARDLLNEVLVELEAEAQIDQ